jgi:DNA-binding response OmpR family regulator
MNILLLEDDIELSSEIVSFLNNRNIQCDFIFEGNSFIEAFKKKKYQMVILDINVPGINGLEVCKQIREIDKKVPVLFLTAMDDISDKVTAFNYGADDYITKPFNFEELFIRINALVRRSDSQEYKSSELLIVDDLTIDKDNFIVKRNGQIVEITPKEFQLLVLLVEANGRVLPKPYIASKLWEEHVHTNQNTIEVYVNLLRNKIDKEHENKLIHTKIGFGYFLKSNK